MNLLHTILDSPLIDRLGWTLLHSLWEGAGVALLLALLLASLRRRPAQGRYLVACGGMLALAAMPLVTFLAIPGRSVSTAASEHITDTAMNSPTPVSATTTHFAVSAESNVERRNPAPMAQSTPGVAPTKTVPISSNAQPAFVLADRLRIALPWIVLAWAAGVLMLAIWNLGGWIAIHQLKSMTTRPTGAAVEAIAAKLAYRLSLHRPVRLLQSALAQTPLVIGAIKPVILLPASVLTELSVAELESILAHELAHVLRHDYLVNLLQTVIETLLFYHPAVWWLSRRVRIERENCCDDIALSVTRDRAAYVTALAAVASVRVPLLAPAASGGKLLPRLRRVLGIPDTDAGRSSRWMAGVIVIALCLLATILTSLKPAAKAEAVKDEDLVVVHGRVVDPSGNAVAGARVMSIGHTFDPQGLLSESRTGADGAFTISFQKSKFPVTWNWRQTVIGATAPHFGPGWAKWDHVDAAGNVVLTLATDDVPIEGRILDLEGRPVVGAKVTATTLARPSHFRRRNRPGESGMRF